MQEQYTDLTKRIMKENNTGYMRMFYPMLIQLPVFTGYYFALTAMCNNHLPSMVVDAAPYGFDLTTVDPYHLLNVSVPATLMAAVCPIHARADVHIHMHMHTPTHVLAALNAGAQYHI